MTECNKCGDCCDVIRLKQTKQELRERKFRDYEFLMKNWKRISKSVANSINPSLVKLELVSEKKSFYYSCEKFNSTTRTCEAHEERPSVCRGFPWYNGLIEPNQLTLSPYKRCSFWNDVDKSDWLEGVIPLEMV